MVRSLPNPEAVIFTGALFGEAKWQCIESAHVVVCTSRSEGMPMFVLEGLALGKPCIVTPGSRMQEFVRQYDCGWACEESAEAIAAAIVTVARTSPEHRSRGQRGWSAVGKILGWESIAARSIAAYTQLLA
jgi:glycosyltransferase involved in cell wall biosynthesis